MIVKTLFNPMRLSVNGAETPIIEHDYLDEDGKTQKVIYAISNGEKVVIQRRWDLEEKIEKHQTLDVALVKVEEARLKKIEDAKDDEPVDPKDPIDPIKP